MADDDRMQRGILGDINPEPAGDEATSSETSGRGHSGDEGGVGHGRHDEQSMEGGSQHDRTEHAGTRDVTEGTTGGTGTEVGGTRNYRTGTGATGTDIGGRPE